MLHDKSQDSTAKHLSCGELLHYKFIIQSAGEKKFKICKHLSKLQAKWLIASYAPFALDFCYQRCRTLQISKNFTEAIDSGISWAMCKSAPRSRQTHQHPTTCFTGRMPFLLPNQQRQSTEGSC